jgi:hypothetical protein
MKIIYLMRQYRHICFWMLVIVVTILAAIASYPKTAVTMAVHTRVLKMLDKDGNVLPEFSDRELAKIQKKLHEKGVELLFSAQNGNENEKSTLEYLVSNPKKIDFAIYGNYGGHFSDSIKEKITSLGVVRTKPFYFLVKKGSNIRLLKDLKGKKIAFWTSPEGSAHPAFTLGGDKASPYSSDQFLEKFFDLAGVTAENSTLINTWPKPISLQQNWDVAINPTPPPDKKNRLDDMMDVDVYKAVLEGNVKYLEFEDIEAIGKNLSEYKLVKISKSLMDPAKNYPPENFITLGVTESVFAPKNLDSSLVLILSEALRGVYDSPTKLATKGEYPNFSSTQTFPPNKVSEKFYHDGDSSILKKYFSQTLAAFIEKLIFILAPLFLVIYPLMTFLPKALSNYCQSKVTKYYKEIYSIEEMLKSDMCDHGLIQVRLDQLDKELGDLKLPLIHDQFVQEIFIVREHIEMIKRKLRFK